MNRRTFLQQTSRAAMVMPFMQFPALPEGAPMGIIVHSYAHRWSGKIESKEYPPFKDAIDLLEHCYAIGAGGVQVTVRDWSERFSKKVRDRREKLGMYIEGSIALPKDATDTARFERDIIAANEAGASIVRTVCLSGRRYETFRSREAFLDFKRRSIASLELAEPLVRKHRTRLAVENHKDWRAAEMVQILKGLDSEWVGVNLDFGNNVALMEEPMEVAKQLAPFLFTTHVKDMGVAEYPDGFLLSEVPLGEGFLKLKEIFHICRQNRADVHFNLEMITRDPLEIPCLTENYWSTFVDVSPQELAMALRMVRRNNHETALPRVSQLDGEQRLAIEEENILESLQFSKNNLRLE
jgi:sugar phosphate isomerase/epimerase